MFEIRREERQPTATADGTDRAIFENLATQHYEQLYRFALSLTGAEPDARDLTQQTFYIWASKGHQLRDRSKVKTWLFTTLHRAFLEIRRRKSRFPHHALDDVAPEDLPVFSADFSNVVDSSRVLAALAKVDKIYQGAVALFYLEDYSYKEIAEILQVPVGTVKSRLARGLTQLREIFEGYVSERSQDEDPGASTIEFSASSPSFHRSVLGSVLHEVPV
jgi:RNA polymerase sigma factor (sigma-70 family)